MGVKEIRGYLRKKTFSSVFWIFQVLFSPSGKGRKKAEKGRKKADFGRFPGGAARHPLNPHLLHPHLRQPNLRRGQKNRTRKKTNSWERRFPGTFSDQCSLDFAYFLCLFSGRRAKSSQERCSWELFFLILGGFSPSD